MPSSETFPDKVNVPNIKTGSSDAALKAHEGPSGLTVVERMPLREIQPQAHAVQDTSGKIEKRRFLMRTEECRCLETWKSLVQAEELAKELGPQCKAHASALKAQPNATVTTTNTGACCTATNASNASLFVDSKKRNSFHQWSDGCPLQVKKQNVAPGSTSTQSTRSLGGSDSSPDVASTWSMGMGSPGIAVDAEEELKSPELKMRALTMMGSENIGTVTTATPEKANISDAAASKRASPPSPSTPFFGSDTEAKMQAAQVPEEIDLVNPVAEAYSRVLKQLRYNNSLIRRTADEVAHTLLRVDH